MRILEHRQDPCDKSIKFLIEATHQRRFEGVYLPDPRFYGFCASSQIGCNMGCTFCATALQRNEHNLSADEIVASIELMNEVITDPLPLDFVTLAGMGEPLANYRNTSEALERLRTLYPSISIVSLSTIGLRNGLRKLVDERRKFRLYVSLHATSDETRRKLIPLAREYSITELLDTVSAYGELNGPDLCRVSYLLLKGINDTPADLARLIALMKGRPVMVQLLLWNPVEGFDFERVDDRLADTWCAALNEADIDAYVMRSMGRNVGGACGQLNARKRQMDATQ